MAMWARRQNRDQASSLPRTRCGADTKSYFISLLQMLTIIGTRRSASSTLANVRSLISFQRVCYRQSNL